MRNLQAILWIIFINLPEKEMNKAARYPHAVNIFFNRLCLVDKLVQTAVCHKLWIKNAGLL